MGAAISKLLQPVSLYQPAARSKAVEAGPFRVHPNDEIV